MKPDKNIRLFFIAGVILFTALTRLIPHLPNYSSLGAMCLVGGAYLSDKRWAIVIPLLSVWLSDLIINNTIYASYFDGFTLFYDGFHWQYMSYILTVITAMLLLKTISVGNVLRGIIAASIIFFLISNFGVWASSTMYPKTFSGLIACYVAAIPFITGTVLGNLVYSVILFGMIESIKRWSPNIVYK